MKNKLLFCLIFGLVLIVFSGVYYVYQNSNYNIDKITSSNELMNFSNSDDYKLSKEKRTQQIETGIRIKRSSTDNKIEVLD